MSFVTKRRMVRLVIVATLVLPLQLAILGLLRSSRTPLHAKWVLSLTLPEIQKAASQIHEYPVMYRKTIMDALGPFGRANVWRQNAQAYLRTHPVSADQRTLIDEITEAHVTERLANPISGRAELLRLEQAVSRVLGPEAFRYLFLDIGPSDNRFASAVSALPWRIRLEDFARRHLLANADDATCTCRAGYTDCAPGESCRITTGCNSGNCPLGWCDGDCKPLG